MKSGYYPPGAKFVPSASYNQVNSPEIEVEVTVSITLSKTVKVLVDDYKITESADENGSYASYDLSECNLNRAVENQVVLPQNLAEYTERMFNHDLNLKAAGMPKYLKDAITDCKDWHVDEIEIIKD